ncbi:hypothetical protein LTR74_017683 [Friedmanniomyces endolithicus]|nr:hypothetical protein LTR74_017683 [Friedmanniomyces endolithicus]
MFNSLKVIAKESRSAGAQQRAGLGGEDPEDKEVLRYHILLIENINHHVEDMDDGGKEGVLVEGRGKAMLEFAEALEAYVSRVITRPLGKLLPPPDKPDVHRFAPFHSRKTARSLFAQYDGKEVRHGVETLRKRIDKHFGDADEEVIPRGVVALVGRKCERAYERTIERKEGLVREVWPPVEGEKGVEVDFTREDVKNAFKGLQRSS